MTDRSTVYSVIDGERAYQETRWNPNTTTSGGKHSVGEWLVYMHDYLNEAMHHCSRYPDPAGSNQALVDIRKITAMGVAAMEQLGAPRREGF